MSLETYADSAAHQATGLPPTAEMRCPCCRKKRTADSIVRVDGTPAVRAAAAVRFGLAAPVYVCTPALATLTREGLVTRQDLPRRTRTP